MTCSTEKNRQKVDQKPARKTGNAGRGRRRTAFSDFQLDQLELVFEQTKYLIGDQRMELANRLKLDSKQVKIWFQNRRIKHRRKQLHSDNSSTTTSDSD